MRKTLASIMMAVTLFAPVKSQSLYNCEDRDVVPCYTFDEGQWRVVRSYAPYRYQRVYLCPKSLPCLMPEIRGKRVLISKR